MPKFDLSALGQMCNPATAQPVQPIGEIPSRISVAWVEQGQQNGLVSVILNRESYRAKTTPLPDSVQRYLDAVMMQYKTHTWSWRGYRGQWGSRAIRISTKSRRIFARISVKDANVRGTGNRTVSIGRLPWQEMQDLKAEYQKVM